MIEGKRSATAERVAMRRAAHQLFDRPRVFEDPLALRILSDERAEEVRRVAGEENAWARGLRAFVAARSRFAEEALARAVAAGVRQYVVLGAGLDTFAYRNPWVELTVFEVDFPETQAWKRERLEHAKIAIPGNARFAAVDFERQSLAGGLAEAGFQQTEPAFFSWLGVVPYLTREAAFGTLRFVAGLPRGSGLALDYAIPPEQMGATERAAFEVLAARVAWAGEPFRLFFDPAALHEELRALGLREIEDLDGAAIRQRWFGELAEQRLHGRAGRLLCAWV